MLFWPQPATLLSTRRLEHPPLTPFFMVLPDYFKMKQTKPNSTTFFTPFVPLCCAPLGLNHLNLLVCSVCAVARWAVSCCPVVALSGLGPCSPKILTIATRLIEVVPRRRGTGTLALGCPQHLTANVAPARPSEAC